MASLEVNRLHVGVEGWGRNSEVCGEGMSYMNLSYQCSLVLEPFMSNTCTLEQTRLPILGKPPLPLCAVQPAAAPFPESSTAAVSTLLWIQKHLMYRPTQPRGLSRRHQNDRVLQAHDNTAQLVSGLEREVGKGSREPS